MRRFLLALVPAVALVLAGIGSTALASPASGPGPGIVYNASTTANPPPQPFDFQAGPLISYCGTGEFQVGWFNTAESAVAQWDSTSNDFITPGSGHTIFCQKNKKTINGVAYWEYAAVLNGAESNNCATTEGLARGNSIQLDGCSAGQSDELFVSVDDTISGHWWIIADSPNSCIKFDTLGAALLQDGTSTNLADCSTTSWQQYDWSVTTG